MGEGEKRSPRFRALLVLLILLLLMAAAWFVLFRVNQFSLSIRLKGEKDLVLEYGETYMEPGTDVILSGTLFLPEGIVLEDLSPEITGELAEEKIGTYKLYYRTELFKWQASAVRNILIVDTKPPVITLTPEPEGHYVPGTLYEEPGFKATDNYDGDITERVKRIETTGLVTYAVTDSSGNPAVAERQIPDYDPVAPVITLVGGEDYTIPTGTVYSEPGYTAEDDLDGDLTEQVTVEGEVDWLTPGIYPITYRVSDGRNNETSVIRKVTVTAAQRQDTEYPRKKTIYLTFDDGPGPYTGTLLDILDKYGVKATFFVVDSGYDRMMKEIVRRGHSIGIHSVTHNYEQIYASPEAFFADLHQMQEIIYQNTGERTWLMRFPGGSSNEISRKYSEGIMTILTEAVQNAGFRFFDWNVISGDAGETTKTDEVRDYVINGVKGKQYAIVLQHDIHAYSVAAVEEIILWGLENGYQFRSLQENSPGFHQTVFN